jgi:hypothetical protein
MLEKWSKTIAVAAKKRKEVNESILPASALLTTAAWAAGRDKVKLGIDLDSDG